jgi:hypothetical protein
MTLTSSMISRKQLQCKQKKEEAMFENLELMPTHLSRIFCRDKKEDE